jgi:hypothetical protein
MTRRRFLCVFIVWLAATPADASAGQDKYAVFALIIGVNQSVDKELGRLRYADDDAARYFDLFRTLGSRTYLLTRLDKNTRRLHAQAAAEADIPREANLRRAVSLLAADVRKARLRKLKTVFYFVYAGHGNTKKQTSYITLEDQRLSGPTLRTLINKVGPHQTHIIVDACHSYFLAHSRGPGGRRRRLRGYSKLKQVFSDRVGLLLSTTSAKKKS